MDFEVKMTREQVNKLNKMAHTNWEAAQTALEIVNSILGTEYTWFAGRVSFWEYRGEESLIHDAWAWAK